MATEEKTNVEEIKGVIRDKNPWDISDSKAEVCSYQNAGSGIMEVW